MLPASKWTILCDFDGTISVQDVTDTLLSRYGKPGCEELEAEWEAGRIGSRACMSGQIALMDASSAEVDACLEQIQIDPQFAEFSAWAHRLGIEVKVLSDGLDYAIRKILARNGIDGLPVAANHLVQAAEREWQLEFPYARPDCRKASGNCKCAHMRSERKVIFIGDGSSDFCASHQADIVLAKDRLIDYCQRERIPYQPIHGFADALRYLQQIGTRKAPWNTRYPFNESRVRA